MLTFPSFAVREPVGANAPRTAHYVKSNVRLNPAFPDEDMAGKARTPFGGCVQSLVPPSSFHGRTQRAFTPCGTSCIRPQRGHLTFEDLNDGGTLTMTPHGQLMKA